MALQIRQGLTWLAMSKRGRIVLLLPAVLFFSFFAVTVYKPDIALRIPSLTSAEPSSQQQLICPTTDAASASVVPPGDVNWSRFAYVQYVTNSAYLCNSVMLFETLHRLGSKADRQGLQYNGDRYIHGEKRQTGVRVSR